MQAILDCTIMSVGKLTGKVLYPEVGSNSSMQGQFVQSNNSIIVSTYEWPNAVAAVLYQCVQDSPATT